MIRRPPKSTLFPYTTSSDLKRSLRYRQAESRGRGSGGSLPPEDRLGIHQDAGGGRACGPISNRGASGGRNAALGLDAAEDRKSTRLNSSHTVISYAVFCLKK